MKTQKAMLDSMFAKLDNTLKAKIELKKTNKGNKGRKHFKRMESDSNVPTETYTVR